MQVPEFLKISYICGKTQKIQDNVISHTFTPILRGLFTLIDNTSRANSLYQETVVRDDLTLLKTGKKCSDFYKKREGLVEQGRLIKKGIIHFHTY